MKSQLQTGIVYSKNVFAPDFVYPIPCEHFTLSLSLEFMTLYRVAQ